MSIVEDETSVRQRQARQKTQITKKQFGMVLSSVRMIDSTVILVEMSVDEITKKLNDAGKGYLIVDSPKPKPRRVSIHACHVSHIFSEPPTNTSTN